MRLKKETFKKSWCVYLREEIDLWSVMKFPTKKEAQDYAHKQIELRRIKKRQASELIQVKPHLDYARNSNAK